jgi:DNA-binding transcriptional ArsR family regulator
MTKSAVSHQLAILKANNIVKSRRDGKQVYYSFDDEHITDIIEIAQAHIKHQHD